MTSSAKDKKNVFESLKKLVFSVGPDIVMVTIFGLTLTVLMIIFGGKITFVQSSIILPLSLLAILIIAAFLAHLIGFFMGRKMGWKELVHQSLVMVRDWSPVSLIAFIYENFHDLTDLIRPIIVDPALRRIDEWMFGIEPTLVLEKITTPWLTEYMTFVYALYFGYPVLILGIVYYKKQFTLFREMVLAMTLCFYLGLLGYMSVPAIGPRYFMDGEFTVPLSGIWLTAKAAAAWNHFESIKRDCFPSLHTAISSIGLIYLWRIRKLYKGGYTVLYVCIPLIVSLWFSTLYLRYHWTIDVFAGWALAFICAYTAPFFTKWYYRNKLGEAPMISLDYSKLPAHTEPENKN